MLLLPSIFTNIFKWRPILKVIGTHNGQSHIIRPFSQKPARDTKLQSKLEEVFLPQIPVTSHFKAKIMPTFKRVLKKRIGC